jgi:hypothetical protein
MGNRSRRELEGQAILRDMLAHPPRERVLPTCDIKDCNAPAVIGAYTWRGNHYFCEAHRAEADKVFERG